MTEPILIKPKEYYLSFFKKECMSVTYAIDNWSRLSEDQKMAIYYFLEGELKRHDHIGWISESWRKSPVCRLYTQTYICLSEELQKNGKL